MLPPQVPSEAKSFESILGLETGEPENWALDIPPEVQASLSSSRPDRVRLSYRELNRRAAALQEVLSEILESAGEEPILVLLFERTSAHLYIAWLAGLRAGAAVSCVDPSFPDGFLEEVLSDAQAPLLLTDTAGAARARGLAVSPTKIIDVAARAPDPSSSELPQPASVPAQRLAYVIYTSGTTGKPKGVMIERGSLANLISADFDEFGIGEGDRVAQVSSPAYDSWVEETWLAWSAGATLVIVDKQTQRLGPDLAPWLREEGISVLCPPPTLLRMAAAGGNSPDLPDLRLLYVGGEALTNDVVQAWAPGRRLVNGYGPTECTVTVIRGDVRQGEEVTLGSPVPGNEVLIENEDGEWLVGPGTGELCLSGRSLARGYLRRAALTAEKFPHRHGVRFYRTGDAVERGAAGELLFRGRIDAQVKLNGQRIELEAIEARLAESSQVRDVACAVQVLGDRDQLTAHLVPSSKRTAEEFALLQRELTAKLARELPHYMVPHVFAAIEEIPRGVSGKVLRRDLPVPAVQRRQKTDERIAPRTSLEISIAEAFATALNQDPQTISKKDDFFTDLGGDSLTAVRALVALRELHGDTALSTRTLYEARTVAALADKLESASKDPAAATGRLNSSNNRDAGASERASRRTGLVTALQAGVLTLELTVASLAAYLVAVHFLPQLLVGLGLPTLLLLAPLSIALGRFGLSFCAAILLALVKRTLWKNTKPGRIPVWSLAYFRAWLLSHWSSALPWSLVEGTALHTVLLRLLGAKVGARVHLHRGVSFRRGAWDLLEIGDDVTVAQDAALLISDLEDGCLVQGPVRIGAGATLDVRSTVAPHCSVGKGAFLHALSFVPSGGRLEADMSYDGLPAARVGAAPTPPEIPPFEISPARYSAAHLALRLASTALSWLPTVLLLLVLAKAGEVSAPQIAAWVTQPSFTPRVLMPLALLSLLAIPLSLFASALFMRAVGEIRPGTLPRWSYAYLRLWWKSGQLERAGQWLSGSLFWPMWLRLVGMRVGAQCEISTTIDVIPERVSIGPSSFFADGIYLGGPRVHRGTVTIEDTALGRDIFLGNHVVIRNGTELPSGAFYGVCTVAHPSEDKASAWFGHPPMQLPRREVREADRALTHEPGALRFANRWIWESARFSLPLLPLGVGTLWLATLGPLSPIQGLLLAPLATLGSGALLCSSILALKWTLLGKVRPGEHALWSCWCSRWDFVYVAWQFWARSVLARLEGTLILAPFLRAMGMKVGRRVVLGDGFSQVVDPDMLHFEDDVTVNGLFQAHSFEDRILKLDHVRIGREASVAHGALLFYDVELKAGARLLPHAVAMKGERLAARDYGGCPCAPAGTLGAAHSLTQSRK